MIKLSLRQYRGTPIRRTKKFEGRITESTGNISFQTVVPEREKGMKLFSRLCKR